MKQQSDPRHQARIIALQTLFEWSFNSTKVEDIIERDIKDYIETDSKEEEKDLPIDKDLSLLITRGVTENLDALDRIIETTAPEWPIDQIAKVDLEILRIAIFELYIARSVPPKVAIDEAVELGKEFGGENTSKFVNGVLGAVVKQLMPEVTNEGEVRS
jgi:N utilization substance protein B